MASFTLGDEQVWRALTQAAYDPATGSDLLLARVKATAGRAMPCTGRRAQSAFVALQALARAVAEGTRARRMRLSDCMVDLALECADLAGWTLVPGQEGELQRRSPVNVELFAPSLAA